MKIYIASSWKNQHAVEMLTNLLMVIQLTMQLLLNLII